MLLGLTRIEDTIIRDILKPYKNDYSFYYFGARTNGTYTISSDLDILIKGKDDMPQKTIFELEKRYTLSNLAFIVHFTNYSQLDKSTYNLIEKELIPVFDND